MALWLLQDLVIVPSSMELSNFYMNTWLTVAEQTDGTKVKAWWVD